MIRLICGYRRTGKDTLGHHLITVRGPYSWRIYYNPSSPLFGEKVAFPKPPGIRLSFAGAVKKQVMQKYHFPPDFDMEKYKDAIVRPGKTFRDLCIEEASKMKAHDPYYWAKIAFEPFETRGLVEVLTVTDWRFPEEYEYAIGLAETVTIRVYRKNVPIPEKRDGEDSEHSLDHVTTDFLVVPVEGDHFEAAVEQFPQYSNFKLCFDRLKGWSDL